MKVCTWIVSLLGLGLLANHACAAEAAWRPAKAPLLTRWAREVSPAKVLAEYPRPQMVRQDWLNLNGLWDYAITIKSAPKPEAFQGKILVPFPVESALSGVMSNIDEKQRIWYRRSFTVPASWSGQPVTLHFGAVDFEATVLVNAKPVGQHRGGYDSFSFDVTDALVPAGTNEIVVSVWDPTDASPNPRGKQVRKPDQGIFYTGSSGIWQTVWLEPVPAAHIESLKLTPDLDAGALRVSVVARASGGLGPQTIEAVALEQGREISRAGGKEGEELLLPIKDAKWWTPDTPFLYDLKVALKLGAEAVDSVTSYFGMRKVALGQDSGVTRIFLNNKPFFMLGPLDQGFWPDGLYTAPSDDALRSDIEITKKLGFNMARKHVKVEPDRWYYWCDKLGLLVWQDMPSGDRFIGPRDADIVRTPESIKQFETELKALIETHHNHRITTIPPSSCGSSSTKVGASSTRRESRNGPSAWIRRGSSTTPAAGVTAPSAMSTTCTDTPAPARRRRKRTAPPFSGNSADSASRSRATPGRARPGAIAEWRASRNSPANT